MKLIIKVSLVLCLVLPVAIQAQPGQTDDQVYQFIAVDVKPVVTRDAEPIYPQSAINARIEGTVVVSVVVDNNGAVTNAEIFNSIPQLDNAALEAARRKVFSPGMVGGAPVNTKMNIPIEFVLPDLPDSPAPTTSAPTDDPGDFVDLTGDAVRITIEPDRPRVNIIADRIKPEFDMMNLERSYLPELTGKGEKIVVVDPKARIQDDLIEIKKIINRSR